MKTSSPMLLPLLRSRTQGEVMAALFLHPDREWSLSDLAEHTGVSVATVMREVDRLVAAGMVEDRRVGRSRLVRVVTGGPVYRPMAELLAVTFGPVGVLRELLTGVWGVRAAYIYGSWAARYAEVPGAVPGDVDVLVVGKVNPADMDAIVERAEAVLRREVNVRVVSEADWTAEVPRSFVATVRQRPLVTLVEATDD